MRKIVFLLAFAFCSPTLAQEKQDATKFWKTGESALNKTDRFKDEKDKKFRADARVAKDKIVLVNRGIVVSQHDYKEGVDLEFLWRWVEGDARGNYQDVFSLILHTDGAQKPEWAHEIANGIAIRFFPQDAGRVSVEYYTGVMTPTKSESGIRFDQKTDYRIRVVEKDRKVTVFIDGKEFITADMPEIPQKDGEAKVAFYNRESVARIVQRSELSDSRISKPK